MNIITNPHVSGLVVGIISGIIVFFITSKYVNYKSRYRYYEQLDLANKEILNILQPYVAERGLPDEKVIEAIILSTARKFKVTADELFSIETICEELVSKIIGDVFVSSEQKKEYTEDLKDHLIQYDEKKKSLREKERDSHSQPEASKYQERFNRLVVAVVTSIAGMLMMGISLYYDMDSHYLTRQMVTAINSGVVIVALGIFCIYKAYAPRKKKKVHIQEDKEQ